jgi:hypothetical protein
VSIKDKSNMCSRFSPNLPKEGLKDILSVLTVPLQRFPPFFLCCNFLREGGGDSCPSRRGRERGSLFSFGHPISKSLRENHNLLLYCYYRCSSVPVGIAVQYLQSGESDFGSVHSFLLFFFFFFNYFL